MNYFFIAGEASGDMHAARLIQVLKQKDPQARFTGLGGDLMREEGCTLWVDYRQMAYMGIVAVLQNIRLIRQNIHICQQALLQEKPDKLILIDYPSFNLKIAKFCKKNLPGTKIIYYIPPKIWAWKKWRIHRICQLSNEVLGIFPFEEKFYAQHGYTCRYVGNPTAQAIDDYLIHHPATERTNIIALLPGSRASEIRKCLPTMLSAAKKVAGNEYQIKVAAAPGIDSKFYLQWIQESELTRDTYSLLQLSSAAIVNSGTATLETALLGCPQTAVYHIACSKWLQWLLEPIIFRIPYYTLVNIVAEEEVIQELIAKRFTEKNIVAELKRLLHDSSYRKSMLDAYQRTAYKLGHWDTAQQVAAITLGEQIESHS